VDQQIMQSGVIPNGINDQPVKDNPDQFFAERAVTMGYVGTTDNALVDFLFNIGERSMIRVRDLTIRPDNTMQKLQGSISLTVSYQKRNTPAAATASATSTTTTAGREPAKTPTRATTSSDKSNSPNTSKTTTQAAPKTEPAKR
ncbi:MAG: hypothetical protein ACK4UN_20390, partial [Limisphaerales bacterium]